MASMKIRRIRTARQATGLRLSLYRARAEVADIQTEAYNAGLSPKRSPIAWNRWMRDGVEYAEAGDVVRMIQGNPTPREQRIARRRLAGLRAGMVR